MSAYAAATVAILWAMLGLWSAAGAADYLIHRGERIETSAGPRESMLHLLEWSTLAIPALACLVWGLGALTGFVATAGVVAHTIATWADTRFAQRARVIPAEEQFAHALMLVLPLLAVPMLFLPGAINGGDAHAMSQTVLAWNAGSAPVHVIGFVTLALSASLLPLVEELIRGLAAARNRTGNGTRALHPARGYLTPESGVEPNARSARDENLTR